MEEYVGEAISSELGIFAVEGDMKMMSDSSMGSWDTGSLPLVFTYVFNALASKIQCDFSERAGLAVGALDREHISMVA